MQFQYNKLIIYKLIYPFLFSLSLFSSFSLSLFPPLSFFKVLKLLVKGIFCPLLFFNRKSLL